jgi:hypothetical protein
VRHGDRIYCVECAQLIMTPANIRAATAKASQGSKTVSRENEIEVLEEYSIKIGDDTPAAKPAAKSAAKARAGNQTGFEVVEEVHIAIDRVPVPTPKARPSQRKEAKSTVASVDEHDDWFKSSKPSASEPEEEVVEQPRQSAAKIAPAPRGGVSNRLPASPKNSGRMNGAKPSARVMPKNKPQPEPEEVAPPIEDEPAPQVAEMVDENEAPAESEERSAPGKISRRGKSVRPSGRMGAVGVPKKMSGRGPAVDDSPKGPSSERNGKSSRRMEAAKSSRRSEREEREEKRDKKRGSSQQGMSTGMMVGIGVGVVALLMIGFALSGKNEDSSTSKKKSALVDEGDKTPSSTYVKMAEESLSAGDKAKAGYYYSRAGDQAQREGNQAQAQSYAMKAYDIKKFTTLNKGR